jgi:hypothetical protein
LRECWAPCFRCVFIDKRFLHWRHGILILALDCSVVVTGQLRKASEGGG